MGIINKFGLYFFILFISYTLMNKLLILDDFLLNIAKTGLFDEKIVYLIAYTAISLEIISIILLLYKTNYGLYFSLCMISLFTIYICFLYYTNRYEICGCGGILNGLNFESHFSINLLLLLILFTNLKIKS